MLLRHTVESNPVKQAIMAKEITHFISSHGRVQQSDLPSFCRHLVPMAWRDRSTLMETIAATCKLVPNNGTTGASWLIALNDKKDQKAQEADKESYNSTLKISSGEKAGSEMQIDEMVPTDSDKPSDNASWKPTVDGTMQFLIQGSQSTRMPSLEIADIESTGPSSSATTTNLVTSASGNKLEKADEHQVAAFSHACFIMSWMSELLASYNECKISFMSTHHRKGKSPAKSFALPSSFGPADVKSKHEILNFMLWKEPSNFATSARSFVLSGLARAIQDAIVLEEPVDTRYGRLYALSDLTFSLLTAAPFAQRPSASPSEAPIQIAKIMLEKNFAVLLSNALADVDLNFPSVQQLLNSILRPLEHLTKAVTKISRASSDQKSGDSTAPPASTIEVESVPPTESSVEDEEMLPTDEHAPYLYRNSALGLYEGELEPGNRNNSPNTSEEEDQFDDDDADMDDLDDGAMLGASDLSDALDKEGATKTTTMMRAMTLMMMMTTTTMMMMMMGTRTRMINIMQTKMMPIWIWEADRGVGNTIVMPQSLDNANDLDEEARNLMNFLNSGAPDLCLPEEGDDQIINAGGARGEIEENLEDEDGGSVADRGHVADDGFEGGSLDFGDEVVIDTPVGDNRGEAAPWSWNGVLPFQPRAEIQTAPVGLGGHPTLLHQATDNVFGRPRTGQQSMGISTHPLLVEDSNRPSRGEGFTRSHRRMEIRSGSVDQWITAIENLLRGGAGQLIEHILGTAAYASDRFRRRHRPSAWRSRAPKEQLREREKFDELAGDARRVREQNLAQSSSQSAPAPSAAAATSAPDDDGVLPMPVDVTGNEDAEMHDGTDLGNQPNEEQSTSESIPVPAAALPENTAMQDVDPQDDIVEVINLARQLADRIGSTAEGSSTQDPVKPGQPPSTIESGVPQPESLTSQAPASSESTDAAPAAVPSQRVTIMINGAEVDITDTGIDPTFLEALPDEMREEVLNQHFREQRPVREELSVPVLSSISTDFLDALPPEIRAELREAVLLEQDDGFISTLPPNLLAEVDALRDRVLRRQHAVRSGRARDPLTGLPVTSASPIPPASKKPPVKIDAVQVLDRSGIAALVRLMFFPQPLRRHSLQKVLVNLCENSRSRTELISTLLGLLQDGTRDAATIDRSFSQVSSRASKALTPVTPKSTTKVRRETHVGPLPHFPGESVPNLIALRCLEALSLLVTSNDRVPIYFLTEQEVPVALHKRSAKKSKGKEKSSTSVTYPIVGLLALLDRASLVKHPNLTESITSLLALIGRPLTSLAKRLEDNKNQPAGTSTSVAASTSLNETGAAPAASETATDRAATRATATSEARPPQTATDKLDAFPTTLEKAPALAAHDLRMIVNVLDSGECSSKTFTHTVTFIQATSTCPNGQEVIAAELLERAKFLGNALLPDLDELSEAIRDAPNAAEVRSTTLAKFSSASAQQAKLLRILKTTEFLDAVAKKHEGIQLPLPQPTSPLTLSAVDVTSPRSVKSTQESQSSGIQFKSLWEKLSECLTLVQERDDMIHIATVILPLMESFLVVCKHAGISSIKLHRGSLSPRPEELSSNAVNGFFLSFTERHRKVLNTMVRNNPGLMSGSFSILVHNPKVLEFDNKRNYFSQQLHKAWSREQYGNVQLNVRRPHVFQDLFHSLARRTGDELKYRKMSVRFYDEEGVDAGGVTREWLTILVKQMLDPNYALFTGSAADSKTYQPNRASAVNPDHLGFFTFCGRVIGKALYDGRVVDAYFTLAFYKHLLGISVGLSDLESVDPDHHRSLKWMLENDIDGIFELTYSVEADDFGSTSIVDLKPGGQEIPIDAFKKGFDEIIPRDLVRIFSATELQLLLNGLPEINVKDWRANTELHQFQQTQQLLWKVLARFRVHKVPLSSRWSMLTPRTYHLVPIHVLTKSTFLRLL
ncbi:hypothetical protein PCASD_19760 [Puccinia coronata f. sp. avenae]|uniref:HECT-type E3 ubiquitin transferase n=1 Tax=Puccinia coronata f. sp. avenae TaxID=200324 RepID=A0A2N5TUG6_9BASI|nr:hypothetical protein PCASD_19760 [Puccinia coronata f. sp. avenae]